MAFFGKPKQTAAPMATPEPTPTATPLFEEAPATSSGPFFGAGPTTGRDPYSGSVSADGGSREADDTESGYHFLTLTPGEEYTIAAIREEVDLDPAMWVFSGHSTYADFQASGELDNDRYFNGAMSSYLDDADDVLPPPGGQGPWADPQVTITAPESGKVTVVVTEVASGNDDGGDGRFDYRLEVSPDPIDIRVEDEGGTSNPFFGEAPKTSTDPLFGEAPTAPTNPFFGNSDEQDDWLTITFGDEVSDLIESNKLLLQLVGNGDVIGDDDIEMPMDGGEPPYLALFSEGGFFSPDNPFLMLEGEDNPWLPALEDLYEEVGSPLTSGSALLMGFAATGDTQTVTFDTLLASIDGSEGNGVAFYMTPHGDAGIIGHTEPQPEGTPPSWQTTSVNLERVFEPDTEEGVMAMFIGVANVGEDIVVEPEGGEIRIEEALPTALLLDNITLVGVSEDGLSPLFTDVD